MMISLSLPISVLLLLLCVSAASGSAPPRAAVTRSTIGAAETHPISDAAPVPFFAVYVDPPFVALGEIVSISWTCYFCTKSGSGVEISLNGTSAMGTGEINGTWNWTVPISSPLGSLNVSVSSSNKLYYGYNIFQIRAPNAMFQLFSPSSNKYSLYNPVLLSWACTQCAAYQTLTFTWWSLSSSDKGILIAGVPLADSGYINLVWPSILASYGMVNVTAVVDQNPALNQIARVTIMSNSGVHRIKVES